jgi:hypothetical protein
MQANALRAAFLSQDEKAAIAGKKNPEGFINLQG